MEFGKTFYMIAISAVLSVFHSTQALADPPSRVGRISYAEGSVSTHTPDQDQWYEAAVNVPVTTGDSFWTQPDARLEIQVGGMEIRADHQTELDVTQLDDEGTVVEVPEGTLNIHIRHLPVGGVQVITPSGQIELTEPGTYHVETGHPQGNQPADREYITALEGHAIFSGERTRVKIRGGEAADIAGYPPSISVTEASADPFDDWALARERRHRVSHAVHYVSPQITGYEDLDEYGRWGRDPHYGAIWYPEYVPADWAPYRYGHWAYVSPWGWTWIDDQPWGFAPFHYGRWVHHHDRWAWYPGEVEEHPVYAPALVAFIGGRHFGVSLSLGESEPVGWLPLAPDEPYHPYYEASDRYRVEINRTTVNNTIINNVNVNNTTIINNSGGMTTTASFANKDAATIVPATAFVRGAHVRNSAVKVSQNAISTAAMAPPDTISKLRPTMEARAGGEAKPGKPVSQAAPPTVSPELRSRLQESRRIRARPEQPSGIAKNTANNTDENARPENDNREGRNLRSWDRRPMMHGQNLHGGFGKVPASDSVSVQNGVAAGQPAASPEEVQGKPAPGPAIRRKGLNNHTPEAPTSEVPSRNALSTTGIENPEARDLQPSGHGLARRQDMRQGGRPMPPPPGKQGTPIINPETTPNEGAWRTSPGRMGRENATDSGSVQSGVDAGRPGISPEEAHEKPAPGPAIRHGFQNNNPEVPATRVPTRNALSTPGTQNPEARDLQPAEHGLARHQDMRHEVRSLPSRPEGTKPSSNSESEQKERVRPQNMHEPSARASDAMIPAREANKHPGDRGVSPEKPRAPAHGLKRAEGERGGISKSKEPQSEKPRSDNPDDKQQGDQ